MGSLFAHTRVWARDVSGSVGRQQVGVAYSRTLRNLYRNNPCPIRAWLREVGGSEGPFCRCGILQNAAHPLTMDTVIDSSLQQRVREGRRANLRQNAVKEVGMPYSYNRACQVYSNVEVCL